jgi:hypothetical protein
MAMIPETEPTLKEVTGAGSVPLVSKFLPFGMLTTKQAAGIIAHLRFANDPRKRRELLSAKSLKLSPGEWLTLIRVDQPLTILDRLERMEKHYLKVSKLDAKEVRRRFGVSDPDDPGTLAYKYCLTDDDADPRLQIAGRILALIPIARRQLEAGKQALELNEISMLNEQATALLIAPHFRRGLNNLAAVRAGGRKRSATGKEERQALAHEFLEARKTRPTLTHRDFIQRRNPPASAKTLQRGLKDLKS